MVIRVIVINQNRKFLSLQYVDPVTGKRKTKSSGTKSMREAKRLAIVFETELNHGLYKEPSKLSWAEFRHRYETEYVFTETRENSQKRVNSTLNVIERLMSPTKVQQLTPQWVSRFRAKVSQGRTVDTVNLHLRNLKAALNWALSQRIISERPDIKQGKRTKSKKMKGRPILVSEFEAMKSAIPSVSSIGEKWASDWIRLLDCLWWSGLRLSEALILTWDVWGDGIRISVSGEFVFLMISSDDEKGGKDRLYPVAPEFSAFLLKTPESDREGLLFRIPQKVGFAEIPGEVGRKISDFGKLADIVVDRTGDAVKYASSHDLRRAFGFRWSRRIFPAELMELMRHADISTTMKYYVGMQAEMTAKSLSDALKREQDNE